MLAPRKKSSKSFQKFLKGLKEQGPVPWSKNEGSLAPTLDQPFQI